MDSTLILTKTAKGIQEAKTEGGDLNYDAVRLLRLVDGKATLGELRPQFPDLTDGRFLKAMRALQHKGLVRALGTIAQPADERFDTPQLDAQIREVEQEVLQTLDFTKLERNLLDAMRAEPPQAAVAAPAPLPDADQPASKAPSASAISEAEIRTRLTAALRPKVEEELRAALVKTLRPRIEEELRGKLVAALRPALEAEIRSKLTAALRPRVELELRARLNAQLARAAPAPVGARQEPSTHAAAAGASVTRQRLLECMQEAVFQTDPAGKNVYVNPAWTRLTGCSADDAGGKLLAEFFIAKDQRGVAVFLDNIARGGATPPFIEANLARQGDGPSRVEVRAAPLTTISGDIVGVCGTLRDAGAAQERGV